MAPDTAAESMQPFVDIPGHRTLRRFLNAPPIRVPLPFEARPRRGVLAGFLILLMTFAGLFMGLGSVAALVDSVRTMSGSLLAAGLFGGLMGMQLLGGVVVYFIDAARNGPALRVDDNGFLSPRVADEPIPWSAVSSAKIAFILDVTYPAVSLTLRYPIETRRNFLRFGAWRNLYSRSDREILLPILDLAHKRDVAYVVLALVKRHGGRVTGL